MRWTWNMFLCVYWNQSIKITKSFKFSSILLTKNNFWRKFFRGPILWRPIFGEQFFRESIFRGPFFRGPIFQRPFFRGPFFRGPFLGAIFPRTYYSDTNFYLEMIYYKTFYIIFIRNKEDIKKNWYVYDFFITNLSFFRVMYTIFLFENFNLLINVKNVSVMQIKFPTIFLTFCLAFFFAQDFSTFLKTLRKMMIRTKTKFPLWESKIVINSEDLWIKDWHESDATHFPCVEGKKKPWRYTSASSEVSNSQSMHEKERQVEPTFFLKFCERGAARFTRNLENGETGEKFASMSASVCRTKSNLIIV